MRITSRTITRTLWLAGAAVLLGTLVVWLAGGAHLGWTQTSVVEMRRDAFTEIEYPVRHDAFIAGVEFLATGLAVALVLGTAGWVAGRRSATGSSLPIQD